MAQNNDLEFYINSKGVPVPRVTRILQKMISEESIIKWSNSLGFKRQNYQKVLTEAADRGTVSHNAIDEFFKSGVRSNDIPFLGFFRWYTTLCSNNTVEIVFQEKTLVGDLFGGTLDLLLKINGEYYIVDFKTSNRVRYKHFLQIAAYIHLLREVEFVKEGFNPRGVIILQLNKEEIGYNEYLLDFTNLMHCNYMNKCVDTFVTLVNGYYGVIAAEKEFKSLWK